MKPPFTRALDFSEKLQLTGIAYVEGKPVVTVPLDDNVPPHLYDPLTEHVLSGWAD